MMLLLAWMAGAQAAPFDGCTFFSERLVNASWPQGSEALGCAQYTIAEEACPLYKGVALYMGDLVTGRAPEYLIEVTPHWGESVFAEDSQLLANAMENAKKYWKKKLAGDDDWPDIAFHGTGAETAGSAEEEGQSMLFARVVRTPNGVGPWSWPQFNVTMTGAVAEPLCYLGISEHSPLVWSNVEGNPEELVSNLFTSVNRTMCDVPGLAQVMNRTDPRAFGRSSSVATESGPLKSPLATPCRIVRWSTRW